MKKIRIEIHMSEAEAKLIDLISEKAGRSRKNWCENIIKSEIFGTTESTRKEKNNPKQATV